ncbi:MAG: LytTR family DNA-binding domain-containing protein [Sedimentitalea sp.]
MRDPLTALTWPRFLIIAGVVLVGLFSMLMPDISGGLSGPYIVAFWSVHIFAALFILQAVQMLVSHVWTGAPWVQIAVSGAIGALLFTPLAAWLDVLFGVDEITDDRDETWIELLASEFTGLAGIVLLVWIALNATRLVRIEPAEPQKKAKPEPAFWQRVPKAMGRDLVALSAELHYLRVITTQGEALVLFPFGQAVAQLEGHVPGQQIHRSHWVALAHIARLERKGQGAICHTVNGLALPVSRRNRQNLERAAPSTS